MKSPKRIKSNLITSKTILDLPTDALLLILSRLDQKDLRSVSLVCKPFLDLSNHFVHKLTFKTILSARSFREIFTRFPSVNQITLNTKRVVRLLTALSKSQLNINTLKIANCPIYPDKHQMLRLSGKLKIKSLAFGWWFSEVKADQVVEFIRLFPSLEELYFGCYYAYEWDDARIESITLMLPNLRKINLSGHHCLTDHALYALSANCVNLEHIGMDGYYRFTPHGFCTLLLRCRKLKYLELPSFSIYPSSDLLLAETISTCENAHHLSIDFSLVRDATLGIIAKSHASLMSLKIRSHDVRTEIDYTMIGLSAILCAFQGLTKLSICLPLPESDKFLDEKMSELVKSLPCLIGISITSYCPIYTTLFSLIENCPLMECINLNMNVSNGNSCREVPMPRLIRKNYNVKYMRLIPSLDASFMISLATFCPCLKKNWDGDFPLEAFFPINPAVYWARQISSF